MSMLNRIAVAASIADFAVKKFFFDLLKVDTVAATGSLISDAAPLSYGKNVVTAANGTKAVRLPKSVVDSSVVIVNTVSNQTLIVFPELAGDQINAIAAGSSFSLVGGARGGAARRRPWRARTGPAPRRPAPARQPDDRCR